MPKNTKKKFNKKEAAPVEKTGKEIALAELQKLGKQVGGHIEGLKKKYNSLDDQTKKKIIAGLAATAAILSTAHAAKRSAKKRKKAKAKAEKKK